MDNPVDRDVIPAPWVNCLAVIKGSVQYGDVEVVFVGTRSECLEFMRAHKEGTDWDDLMYAKMRPKQGSDSEYEVDLNRLSSWVLDNQPRSRQLVQAMVAEHQNYEALENYEGQWAVYEPSQHGTMHRVSPFMTREQAVQQAEQKNRMGSSLDVKGPFGNEGMFGARRTG